MIWNRVPKSTHVGLQILTFVVYSAIAHFNYGAKTSLDVFNLLNIEPGLYMTRMCNRINLDRKRNSAYRMSVPAKKRRKVVHHDKQKKQDFNINAEGTTYESGGC